MYHYASLNSLFRLPRQRDDMSETRPLPAAGFLGGSTWSWQLSWPSANDASGRGSAAGSSPGAGLRVDLHACDYLGTQAARAGT